MRCPAIEGIETRLRDVAAAAAGADPVECVAPLLRGLKPARFHASRDPARSSRMRCPAIEGIETRPVSGSFGSPSGPSSNALPRY